MVSSYVTFIEIKTPSFGIRNSVVKITHYVYAIYIVIEMDIYKYSVFSCDLSNLDLQNLNSKWLLYSKTHFSNIDTIYLFT